MSKAKAEDTTMLILFGLDENAKPRAAKFSTAQRDLVKKAAEHLKLEAYEIEGPALAHEIITKLPNGRLYSNGRGFVPNIRRDQYAKLMAALGIADTVLAQATQAGVELKGYPSGWASIEEGHVVIAQCDDVADGWFEALVLKVENDMLTVKWRDYPKFGPFFRHRHAVALVNANPSFPR